MVNKKLTTEEEEHIYFEWLSGEAITSIARKYPVVVSTIHRVIKKKSRKDSSKQNLIISDVSKHIKNANEPLTMAIKSFENNDEMLHEKQQEILLESLDKLNKNINVLIENIKKMVIE